MKAGPLSQLLLCTKTEAINPYIFSAVCLWKQTECEKLQYLQASLVLLETSQWSFEIQSSVGCSHLSLIVFTVVPEKTPSEPQGLARGYGCKAKETEKCLRFQQHLL